MGSTGSPAGPKVCAEPWAVSTLQKGTPSCGGWLGCTCWLSDDCRQSHHLPPLQRAPCPLPRFLSLSPAEDVCRRDWIGRAGWNRLSTVQHHLQVYYCPQMLRASFGWNDLAELDVASVPVDASRFCLDRIYHPSH